MEPLIPASRRVAIMGVAMGTVLSGVLLVWKLATRERIVGMSTGDLAGLLGLFVLPATTLLLLAADRRVARYGGVWGSKARAGGAAVRERAWGSGHAEALYYKKRNNEEKYGEFINIIDLFCRLVAISFGK